MQENKKRNLSLLLSLLTIMIITIFFLFFLINKEKNIPLISIPAPILKTLSPKYETKKVSVFENESSIIPPFEMPPIVQPVFPDRICNIIDYGAVPGGLVKNTNQINSAIGDCFKKGGGHVLIPKGSWLTGAIHLESNIDLQLAKEAILQFSSNPEDYLPVVLSRYEGIDVYNYSPLIYANDKENIAITGDGIIDGNGKTWWNYNNIDVTHKLYSMGENSVPIKERIFGSIEKMLRPASIEFINSNSILLEDFTIKSGPMWTLHPTYSKNIIIRNVSVITNGKNNDGLDIDSSQNVLVENSYFNTLDDAIALKSGKTRDGLRANVATKNIIIRNNTIENGHGAIAIGSEMAGGVQNVFAYNCNMRSNQYGIRIKALENEKTEVKNLWFQDITMDKIIFSAIQMTMHYGSDQAMGNTGLPFFNNIHFLNITSPRTRESIDIDALQDSPVENITIEKSNIQSGSGMVMKNITNLFMKSSSIIPKRYPLYTILNGKNISIDNIKCLASEKICVSINGSLTENIQLKSDNSIETEKKTSLNSEVPKNQVIYE